MIELRLDRDASAARIARSVIRVALASRPAALRDVAVLLADELVTNAVVHSFGEIGLSVEDASEWIRVGVSDASGVAPQVGSPGPTDERGRSLLIVESLASAWGVVQSAEGKSVWFQLDVADVDRWESPSANDEAPGRR
jgi:anti-sigma regulatory factor (Ser/Thr protein kinase)